jgi:hypothetical protein
MFGGNDHLHNVNDTWTWDGTNWTQRNTPVAPAPRNSGQMVYDPVHHQTLLFGGCSFDTGCGYSDTRSYILGDTWAWDGTKWSQLHPATSPPGREYAGMTWDAKLGKIVLFGGDGPTGYLNDTWTWDGTNWTHEHPVTSPAGYGRSASLGYDAVNGQAVLFGGYTLYSNAPANYLNDTWTYDGVTWTQRNTQTAPPARSNHTMTTGPNGQVLLFGGFARGTYFADTWSWNGKQWTQVTTATAPGARSGARMTFDSVRGEAVLFGGNSYQNDTWTLHP